MIASLASGGGAAHGALTGKEDRHISPRHGVGEGQGLVVSIFMCISWANGIGLFIQIFMLHQRTMGCHLNHVLLPFK